MSILENIVKKFIENEHIEPRVKNLMQKELIDKKKDIPFHIDCKFSKKRICYCQYFEASLMPSKEIKKFNALSHYLTNYYNGIKDEDYKIVYKKLIMAKEKIKYMQEPEDILYFIPKYQKFLEKEEIIIEKPEDPKQKALQEECSHCKSKISAKFHVIRPEAVDQPKIVYCNTCYFRSYPELLIKKEHHKSKKIHATNNNLMNKNSLGKRKIPSNWQNKHSYVRIKDKKLLLTENLEKNRFCCWKTCNKNDHPEDFLICKRCERSFHAKCCDPPLCKKLVSRFDWFCTECKVCNVCFRTTEENELLICDCCDRAFHLNCLLPKKTEIPEGKWYCTDCQICKCCNLKIFESLENLEESNKLSERIHPTIQQYIFCQKCYPSILNKNYCPICFKIIAEDSLGNFICCDKCLLWCHAECEKLSKQKLKELQSLNTNYICSNCSRQDTKIKIVDNFNLKKEEK